ncbi:MAG: hypothetical protein Q7S63_00360 [bacterium]|nr:hypothetical protein [bacterium]
MGVWLLIAQATNPAPASWSFGAPFIVSGIAGTLAVSVYWPLAGVLILAIGIILGFVRDMKDTRYLRWPDWAH